MIKKTILSSNSITEKEVFGICNHNYLEKQLLYIVVERINFLLGSTEFCIVSDNNLTCVLSLLFVFVGTIERYGDDLFSVSVTNHSEGTN